MRVCFVCLDAFGLFRPELRIPFGGAQYRSVTLARGVAQRSSGNVSFLVYDYGQESPTLFDGIGVFRTNGNRKETYLNAWQQFQRKALDRIQALKHTGGNMIKLYQTFYPEQDLLQCEADAYCIFGLTPTTLEQARVLRKHDRKVLIFLTHDEDVADINHEGSTIKNRHGIVGDDVWRIIHENEVFVCQNDLQAQRIENDFGKQAFLLKNPISLEGSGESSREFILWVGRDSSVKRPLLFLDLVKSLPNEQFVMVLNPSAGGDYESIKSAGLPNLQLIPEVPAHEIETYFAKAKLFVSTSESEGFPNTFLQAGKFSVPVFSMGIDPFGYIQSNRCGISTFRNVDEMTQTLSSSSIDSELNEMGASHFRYVSTHHSLLKVSAQLVDWVSGL